MSNNYLYINFTVMFKYFVTENILAHSEILKIDINTNYVYDKENNFIGKWIYILDSNISEHLELNKPS